MRTPITNFTGGEFSPLLGGRIDVEKFHNSAERIENFIVKPFGCLTKRTGTYLADDAKNQDSPSWLVGFVFSREQTYVLEFSGGRWSGPVEIGGYMRVFSGGGIVVSGGSPVCIDTPYKTADLEKIRYAQDGDIMFLTCYGRQQQQLTRLSHTSWTLAAFETIGGPFGRPNEDEALTIAYSGRVGDVTLTASRNYFLAHHVGEVMRIADGSVRIQTVVDGMTAKGYTETSISQDAKTGVLGDQVLDGAWTSVSGTQSTNTAPKVAFTGAGKVSKTFDLYYTHDYRFAFRTTSGFLQNAKTLIVTVTNTGTDPDKVLGVNTFSTNGEDVFFTISMGDKPDSTTTKSAVKLELEYVCSPTDNAVVEYMDFRDKTPSRGGSCTYDFAEQAFGVRQGYPACVALYQQRLVYACTESEPNALFFSHSSREYRNFDSYDAALATSGIFLRLSNPGGSRICWIEPKRDLWAGCDNTVFKLYSSDSAAAFSASTAKADNEAAYPSAELDAVSIENVLVHVSGSRRMMREIAYTLEQDSWKSIQISLFGEHMLREGRVNQLAWQSEPYGLLWFIREDGSLCCMTYMREQNVVAFHRHPMPNCVVESMCTIPDSNGYDQLWLSTKRLVNGTWKRFIECMSHESDRFHVDCGLQYSGTPTSTISGLAHLAGTSVIVIADGATHPDCVVQPDGTITLNKEYSVVNVGLRISSRVRTHQLEQTIPSVGTLQGLNVKIVNVIARVFDTGANIEVRRGDDNSIEPEVTMHRNSNMAMDYAPDTLTGELNIAVPPDWSSDSTFELSHNTGTTCNILCLIAEWSNA